MRLSRGGGRGRGPAGAALPPAKEFKRARRGAPPVMDAEVRKLQVSGGSTYVVSLPRSWVEGMGLRAGDGVAMSRNANSSLTLYAGPGGAQDGAGGAPGRRAVIMAGRADTGETIGRRLIAAYLAGYGSIVVRARGGRIGDAHGRAVRGIARASLIGTEIVESTAGAITMQVLTRLPELSFETAVRRMHRMASSMHAEAVEALAGADAAHAEEIVAMDDEVDRFSLYTRRNLMLAVDDAGVLAEMGLASPSDCVGYRAVIERIERIADHAAMIAKRVKFLAGGGIDAGLMGRIGAVSAESLRAFDGAVESVLGRDCARAEGTAPLVRGVVESEKAIMSSVSESDANSTVVRFVLEHIRRTAEYSGDIIEVAIDENIRSVIAEE